MCGENDLQSGNSHLSHTADAKVRGAPHIPPAAVALIKLLMHL